jgi:hypothetical protein
LQQLPWIVTKTTVTQTNKRENNYNSSLRWQTPGLTKQVELDLWTAAAWHSMAQRSGCQVQPRQACHDEVHPLLLPATTATVGN